MKTELRKKKPKTPTSPKWNDGMYVRAYQLSRQGLRGDDLAAALGITRMTLLSWKRKKEYFADAIKEGRAGNSKNEVEVFHEFVFKRLPDNLKELWNRIREVEKEPNGIRRMEAMLLDSGKRARQHLFLYALCLKNFNKAAACHAVNISPKTYKIWAQTEPDFIELLGYIHDYKKDFFESALIKQVKAGDTASIIFANRTLNRDRGYNDKQEIDIKSVPNSGLIDLNTLKLSLECRKEIMDALKKERERVKIASGPQSGLALEYKRVGDKAVPSNEDTFEDDDSDFVPKRTTIMGEPD